MEIWFLVIIFILGLCGGSFVNMLVYRTAERYELESRKFRVKSKNRSFCDYCGRQLSWYENVPVISWVIQKGRTRCCDKKLSILYPIVEIMTGLLFLIFNFKFEIFNQIQNLNFQMAVHLIVGLVIITFLVFSAVFDLKYMILPDFSTIVLIFASLAVWYFKYYGQWSYFLSGLLSFGFLGILHLITKGKGMGLGDVKLALFMGLFLGYPKTVVAMYVAFLVGAGVSLLLLVFKRAKKKTLIPFGPFLILGTVVAWFGGSQILGWSVFQFIK